MLDCWTCRHDSKGVCARLVTPDAPAVPLGVEVDLEDEEVQAWVDATDFHGSGPVIGKPRRGKKQPQKQDCPGWAEDDENRKGVE